MFERMTEGLKCPDTIPCAAVGGRRYVPFEIE